LPPAALSTRIHTQLRGTRKMMVIGALDHSHDRRGFKLPRSSFGQRQVVSDPPAQPPQESGDDRPLTPAQAAVRFQVPEYLLRKACSEGHLEHLRVVNALWLAPAAVDTFARSWRAKNGRNS
jgi:hypothetical protein